MPVGQPVQHHQAAGHLATQPLHQLILGLQLCGQGGFTGLTVCQRNAQTRHILRCHSARNHIGFDCRGGVFCTHRSIMGGLAWQWG